MTAQGRKGEKNYEYSRKGRKEKKYRGREQERNATPI
jgi:hypothetical protein